MINIIRLVRPHHWTKNLLVFAGVFFGRRLDPEHLLAAGILFLGFCLASSGAYALNDVLDRHEDAQDPRKAERPLPSGAVSPRAALVISLIGYSLGLGLGFLAGVPGGLTLAGYVGLSSLYSLFLKRVALLDVFTIAAGFMLRLLAGTWGIGIQPSGWLLLAGFFLTLLLALGKRRAEMRLDSARRVLGSYSGEMISVLMGVSAGGALITYALYTLDPSTRLLHRSGGLLYTVPLVIYGIFRYIYLVYSERDPGDPATQLLRDPHLVLVTLLWLLAFWVL